VRDPHGVVAICSPWNFPADEALLLALPALAAGNTVVLKPSEVAPLTGAIVAEALQALLPEGVVELVQGDGAVGAALVGGAVQMVAMTGSSATGRKIMGACAPDLKRLVLELGGKDPMVVFADADLDAAAKEAVEYSLMNCGQVCCSVERIYVEESAKPAFERLCVKEAQAYVAGDGFDAKARIGPMVSAVQRDQVRTQVDAAVKAGAKVLARGPVQSGVCAKGFFQEAVVLSDVTQDHAISHTETFGPVVAISAFDGSEASAIRLANDTAYGLAAYVYTGDLDKARRVAMGIKAGQVGIICIKIFQSNSVNVQCEGFATDFCLLLLQVGINNYSLAMAPITCPWVGAKGSGFGHHSGVDGWQMFSVPKSLVFNSEAEVPAELGGARVVRERAKL
jgi:acyl-CoA reductase-like NAD-dependent aldehyde dehydrogenase